MEEIGKMKIKKWDMLMFLLLLALAGGIYYFTQAYTAGEGSQVVVRQAGKVIASHPLEKDGEFWIESEWGKNKIIIHEKQVQVQEADCPDKVCVKHRPIYLHNEIIVCLPHKLVIEIVNPKAREVDKIAN